MSTSESWRPAASLDALRRRAELLSRVREFFAVRKVLEVETPILSAYGVTEPHIENLCVPTNNEKYWLRTSPEYHMKRLLASGSPDIYQVAKSFRAGEQGSRHQPEFTLIEWYRQGYSLPRLIAECVDLITELSLDAECAISEVRQHSYCGLFAEYCEVDPLNCSAHELRATAQRHLANFVTPALTASLGEDQSAWLDLLASHLIYPALKPEVLHVVTGYPANQAMLARLNPDNPQLADRFELFLNGLELANGFHELTAANEQARRFETDRQRRTELGLEQMEADINLLAALTNGLPDCCGVAVGLDRLIQATDQHAHISSTMAFVPGS